MSCIVALKPYKKDITMEEEQCFQVTWKFITQSINFLFSLVSPTKGNNNISFSYFQAINNILKSQRAQHFSPQDLRSIWRNLKAFVRISLQNASQIEAATLFRSPLHTLLHKQGVCAAEMMHRHQRHETAKRRM